MMTAKAHHFIPAIIAIIFGLSACDAPIEQPSGETIRPVKTVVIGDPGIGGERRLPGRIESARRVELAFRVAGKGRR